MAYCDYDFYTNEYYGNLINEEDWNRVSSRASDKLDQLTYDRLIDSTFDERTTIKIKKAVCKLAELMFDVETSCNSTRLAKDVDGMLKGRAIASISAGGESVTFATPNNVLSNAMGDAKELEKVYFEAVREYLGGTGLLYAGI